MDYSAYIKRITAHGDNMRERKIDRSRYMFEKSFEHDPSYKENVEILNKGTINIQMDGREIVQDIPTMKIRARLSEDIRFIAGDTFFYDDGYWLCTDSSTFHDTYRRGEVEECNYLLRWQNPQTFDIVSRWCVVKAPYSSGVEENKILTVGNSKYKIKLPYDSETAMFNYQSRFLISLAGGEPIAYKLIQFDDASNKNDFRKDGFLVIVVQQDESRPDDNEELLIADYKEKSVHTPLSGTCGIDYKRDAVVKAGSPSEKIFTGRFFDDDGYELNEITGVWSLILPSELENGDKIIASYYPNNQIGLKASEKANIGSILTLKLIGEHAEFGYFATELEVKVGDLW